MLRKCLTLIFALTTIFAFNILNNKPIFSRYSNDFTIYVGNGGSLSKIIEVGYLGYLMQDNIKGESCSFVDSEFNLHSFLNEYGAKLVKVECVNEQVSYYAFSPNIKYSQNLFGKKINLHVSIKNDRITVGSPLIYGSF